MEYRNNRVVLQTIIRVYIGIAKLIPRLDWCTQNGIAVLSLWLIQYVQMVKKNHLISKNLVIALISVIAIE